MANRTNELIPYPFLRVNEQAWNSYEAMDHRKTVPWALNRLNKIEGWSKLLVLTVIFVILVQSTKVCAVIVCLSYTITDHDEYLLPLQAIYFSITSPLSKLPGPLLNRLSHWPLRVANIRGRRIFYVDALHARYGQLASFIILIPWAGSLKFQC